MFQVKSKSPHRGRVIQQFKLKNFSPFSLFFMSSHSWGIILKDGILLLTLLMAWRLWYDGKKYLRRKKQKILPLHKHLHKGWAMGMKSMHQQPVSPLEWNKIIIIIIVSHLFFQVHPVLIWGMFSKKVSLRLHVCLLFPAVTKWGGKEDWHVSLLGTGFAPS